MNSLQDILSFNKMIVPRIITFLYWLGLAAILITGVMAIASGSFGGLLMIIFGALGLRIWCELMIVLFKINDNIQKIANATPAAPTVNIDA